MLKIPTISRKKGNFPRKGNFPTKRHPAGKPCFSMAVRMLVNRVTHASMDTTTHTDVKPDR